MTIDKTDDELRLEIRAALCQGRHEFPFAVDGNVFHKDEDRHPLDFKRLKFEAQRFFSVIVDGILIDNDFDSEYGYEINFDLYVTGLSSMLVAFLQEYVRYEKEMEHMQVDMTLTLCHYNRDTGDYERQVWC